MIQKNEPTIKSMHFYTYLGNKQPNQETKHFRDFLKYTLTWRYKAPVYVICAHSIPPLTLSGLHITKLREFLSHGGLSGLRYLYISFGLCFLSEDSHTSLLSKPNK